MVKGLLDSLREPGLRTAALPPSTRFGTISKDGKELFYVEGDSLMAVRVSTDPTLSLGSPQKLFSSEGLVLERSHLLTYDVTPDGERFVLAEPAVEGAEVPEPTIRVVQNWFAEFKDRQ